MGYCLGCKGSRGLSQRVTFPPPPLFLFLFLRTVCVCIRNFRRREHRNPPPENSDLMHVPVESKHRHRIFRQHPVVLSHPCFPTAVEKKKGKKKKANKTSPRFTSYSTTVPLCEQGTKPEPHQRYIPLKSKNIHEGEGVGRRRKKKKESAPLDFQPFDRGTKN